jgi:hypothetical protein
MMRNERSNNSCGSISSVERWLRIPLGPHIKIRSGARYVVVTEISQKVRVKANILLKPHVLLATIKKSVAECAKIPVVQKRLSHVRLIAKYGNRKSRV